jgi:AcrR family transcriptional regulator
MAPRPRQVSDEEILEVAAKCFIEHGAGVATQVIAERLNISQAALFKRFNTKEELMLRALLPPERNQLLQRLDEGPSDAPLKPQLVTLFELLWQMVSFVVPRISVINASGVAPSVIMRRYNKFPLLGVIESLSGWIHRAQDRKLMKACGHPVDLAQAWLGTMQGRALMRIFLPDIIPEEQLYRSYTNFHDDEAYLATVTEFIWRAVGVDDVD